MASSARIDELRKKFEENPRRYFAPLANEYRKAGEIEQAVAICREYLPQQPGHMSGHIVYGQALYEARQFDEAKTVFETALSLDPENLIALRHLGDIALIVGDGEAARGWYRRVLEADPRNEEIQAQLATLDQAASQPAAPAASAPPAGPAATAARAPAPPTPAAKAPTAKPTPSSAPTVVMSAIPRPAQEAPKQEPPVERPPPTVTPDSPTAEIRLDTIPTHAPPQAEAPVEMALGFEPTSASAGNEPVPPASALEIDTPVSAQQAAAPIDSFSLAGLETTSLAAPPPPAPQPAPELTPLPDLDFAAPATSDPAAGAPAPDLEFVEPPAAAPTAVARAAAPADQELPLLDLGELPSRPVAASPPPSAPAAAPPAAAPPAAVPPALPEWSAPPEPAEAVPAAPESGPFVTETMAELYLKQGHREEALRVYRALLDQRPADASLQAKVSGLEAELSPASAARAPDPRYEEPAAVAHAGPTIRELLNAIASRRPGFRPEPPRDNGATPAEMGFAPMATHPAAAASLAPDTLAALFGNAQVAPADEGAALALAFAFAESNGVGGTGAAQEISGAPARRAANDLSLDTVFGAQQAPPTASPSSFSFDQFFSQRATAEHATGSAAPGGTAADSPNDVAQFTQWLEGLKQR